ncbi:hypothetical protein ACQPW1_39120 [Nocardia sp. CA-128927]|uniref:hypothetical protein n=1 Tax=Nocardia sp. CA-128927 TaxID=3239975 RepID=UPI003D9537BA
MSSTVVDQSFTGPETIGRYTSPQFVTNGDGGIRSWLSPIVSTPLGLQFSYTAMAVDLAVSLLDHRVSVVITLDGAPVDVATEYTSKTAWSRADFTVRNRNAQPIERSVDVAITLTDIRADISHTIDFQLI